MITTNIMFNLNILSSDKVIILMQSCFMKINIAFFNNYIVWSIYNIEIQYVWWVS